MKKYSVSVELTGTFEIEAECEDDAIDEAIAKAIDKGEWRVETERIDLPENVRDYNRGEIIIGDKVKFKGSDHIFLVVDSNYAQQFVDLTDATVYDMSDILNQYYPFYFYTSNDDDDFLGVELIERKGE